MIYDETNTPRWVLKMLANANWGGGGGDGGGGSGTTATGVRASLANSSASKDVEKV